MSRTILRITLACCLALFASLGLCACSSSASSTDKKDAEPAAEEVEDLVVTTDSYTITLPESWNGLATVEYDTEGNAQVLYHDSSVVLFTCDLVDADTEQVGGDIGNALVYSADASGDKRLEIWAPNYPVLFWSDAAYGEENGYTYDALDNEQKAEIIKLTCDEDVDIDKLEAAKDEQSAAEDFGGSYEYLGKIFEKNVTIH